MRFTLRCLSVVMAIAALATAAGPGCSGERDLPERVLVFGIDGATWDVIEEMFEAGELPTLKRLYDSGVHGILESRPPVLSPVVWSTIFTGRPWQEHGVRDWKTSQSTHRKVKALWEITSDLGLETVVANVPSSWPVVDIKGAMVAGFPLSGSTVGGNTGDVVGGDVTRKGLASIYVLNAAKIREKLAELDVGEWSEWFQVDVRGRPSWRALMRALQFEPGRYYLTPVYRDDEEMVITHPPTLRSELSKELGEPYIAEGPGWSRHADPDTPKVLYDHLLQVSEIQSKAAAKLAARPWDLFIFIDTFVDRVSHPYWAYMRPADYKGLDPAKAARFGDRVRDAYRATDRQLARVLDAVDGECWVVIVSDHGFRSNRDDELYIGTHDVDGVYLVSVPGVKSTRGSRAYIEDVAPTLLYLLDRAVGSDMTGKVIPDVAALVARPIAQVASYEGGGSRRGTDAPVDAKTWEQLRGLGYVDGPAPAAGAKPPPAKPVAKAPPAKAAATKPPGAKPDARPGAPKPGAAATSGAATAPGAAAKPGAATAPARKPKAPVQQPRAAAEQPEGPR